MREELTASLLPLAADPAMAFLTGDLGYRLFDDLADALGPRFVNAGVAEQNMVGVAAGLASSGFTPWVYSIAPFVFARPFEQVRDDVCLHNLRVRLLGNGAGLSYGVLGPTHHAVEDYGVLLTLPHMRVLTPAFDSDVPGVIAQAAAMTGPCYVRLGRGELPEAETAPEWAVWRRLVRGDGPVVATTSTIGGAVWSAVRDLPDVTRPDVWLLGELPLVDLPLAMRERLAAGAPLIVVEEHVRHGGLVSMLASHLLLNRVPVGPVTSLGLDSVDLGVYGSHAYLRERAGLSPAAIRAAVLAAAGGHR